MRGRMGHCMSHVDAGAVFAMQGDVSSRDNAVTEVILL